MITDNEKSMVRAVSKAITGVEVELGGQELTPEQKALFAGGPLAVIDGLFAIREGEQWRGISEPKEIARELLRIFEVGE